MKKVRFIIAFAVVLTMVFGASLISSYAADSFSDKVDINLNASEVEFDWENDYELKYDSEEDEPYGNIISCSVKDADTGDVLRRNVDYEVKAPYMWEPGEYTIEFKGIGAYEQYEGIATATVTVKPKTVTESKVSLMKTTYVYNGKTHHYIPDFFINGTKVPTYYYTIVSKSYKNTKSIGTATATYKIKFKNGMKGTITKTCKYKIVPKAVTLNTFAKTKNTVTAKWKKHTSQTTGFRIKVCKVTKGDDYDVRDSDSRYYKAFKTIYVKSKYATAKKITGLKKGTRYAVIVQAYKTVNGNKYYSNKKVKFIKTAK